MPVVPFSQQASTLPPAPPLESKYLLMAAAQMHSEGRLIKPAQQLDQKDIDNAYADPNYYGNLPDALPGHEEWESQGQSDVKSTGEDEPPQPDQTNDIMQHLYPKGARNISRLQDI